MNMIDRHCVLRWTTVTLAFVTAWTLVDEAVAQIKLDRLYPPIVAAGSESSITAEGKFPQWPLRIECDRQDVQLDAESESGKLTVSIQPTAANGVAWVRFYDNQSVSKLVPILITSAPVQVETEPNDRLDQATALALPCVVAGRLAKRGDSDAYELSLKGGQTLVASVTANQWLRSPMDAVLQLTDRKGNVLAQSDDSRGLDPQLVYRASGEISCVLRIFAFPETPNSTVGFSGAANYVYAIKATSEGFLDHIANTEPAAIAYGFNLGAKPQVQLTKSTAISPPIATLNHALGWSTTPKGDGGIFSFDSFSGSPRDVKTPRLELPVRAEGHFSEADQVHRIAFATEKGKRYRAEVISKAAGFCVDSSLKIIGKESGKPLASNDDLSRNQFDSAVEFVSKDGGWVAAEIRDTVGGFGTRHFFRVFIDEVRPRFELAVADDHFVLSTGKPLEIPVTVSRLGGFNRKIQVTATGLPEFVSATSVISQTKGDTAKSVKLKLTVAAGKKINPKSGLIGLQVVGRELSDEPGNETPVGESVPAMYLLRPSMDHSSLVLLVTNGPPAKK